MLKGLQGFGASFVEHSVCRLEQGCEAVIWLGPPNTSISPQLLLHSGALTGPGNRQSGWTVRLQAGCGLRGRRTVNQSSGSASPKNQHFTASSQHFWPAYTLVMETALPLTITASHFSL